MSLLAGDGVLTFTEGFCIWRRSVAGSGIPGVGVAPGFIGFPNVFGSGIPGVGVAPFGITFIAPGAGMPGVELADGGRGLAESPGGMLFASTRTATLLF